MLFDFPKCPEVGRLHPPEVGTGEPQYIWNGKVWQQITINVVPPAVKPDWLAAISDPAGILNRPNLTDADLLALGLDAFQETNRLYVRKGITASDSNSGTSPAEPLLTVRRAAELATPGTHVDVGPGLFREILPIRWKRDVQVFGAGLRITRIGGAVGHEYTDIFKVDSGFKCNEVQFFGHQADETRQAWAISFNELANNSDIGAVGLGAFIRQSPYIQNCTSYTAEDDAGLAGSQSIGSTGGGIIIDGDKCAINSPIRSMVVDSFTQVNLGGPGCLVINDGYAQLVSFFGTFCLYHVRCESGGQWNLSGGGTSDFGVSALQADGFSPRALYTAKSKFAEYGAQRLESTVTCNLALDLINIADPAAVKIGDEVTFRADSGTLPGLLENTVYIVLADGFTGTSTGATSGTFKVRLKSGGGAINLAGGLDSFGMPGGYTVLRNGATTVDIINVSANRLGRQIEYPTAGSLGSSGNPVLITGVSGSPPNISFSVTLGAIAGIIHEYVAGGTVRRGGIDYPVTSAVYDNVSGATTISATGFTPAIGDSITLSRLSFSCNSASRPGPGFLMFPRLSYPSAGPTSFTYTRIDDRTFTYVAAAAPNGPTHDYAEGGTAIISTIDRIPVGCTYDKVTGLVTVKTKNVIPSAASGTVTMANLQFICRESRYIVQSALPINGSGVVVANSDPTKAGYRVSFFSDTNQGLRYPLAANQVLDFRRRSQGSAPSHTMEYVGSGVNYDALPDYGGLPVPGNRILETNGGKIFYTSVDELGNYAIGGVFEVDATTGVLTTTARGINLSNVFAIGPFSRNGGFSTVGVQLREVSNNPDMIASTGVRDGNTVPTQAAVVAYVAGLRFVTNVVAAAGTPLTVTGEMVEIAGGAFTFIKTVSANVGTTADTLAAGDQPLIQGVAMALIFG
jgi:hypothetical protein